jgi:hypothetical protein
MTITASLKAVAWIIRSKITLLFGKTFLAGMTILVSLGLAGCVSMFSVPPTPKIETVFKTVRLPLDKAPDYCGTEKHEPFKLVKKIAGNKTPQSEQSHALQSNKRRMVSNLTLVHECRCWIARAGANPVDLEWAKTSCSPAAAPSAAGTEQQATKADAPEVAAAAISK